MAPGPVWTGARRLGWPQGRSGQVRKISPPPGFNPRTVQPVASRYPGPPSRVPYMNKSASNVLHLYSILICPRNYVDIVTLHIKVGSFPLTWLTITYFIA